MRRWSALIVLCLAGCTNAPLAGFLDAVHPSHLARDLEAPPRDQFRPNNDPLGPVVAPPPGGRLIAPTTPPPDNGFSPPGLPPVAPGASPFSGPNS